MADKKKVTIESLKAVGVVAAFTLGTWIGGPFDDDVHANAVEGAKIFEVSAVDPISPVPPRPYIASALHIPKGYDASIVVYAISKEDSTRRFVGEIPYSIPEALHDRYGLVQFNPDFSIQSDALPEENPDEIP